MTVPTPEHRRLSPKQAFLALALFLVGMTAWAIYQFLREIPIVVSKETTFITEPLAEDGLPDYQQYFLDQGFEGVTPENNAAVLLWQALWPMNLDEKYRPLMCDALGIAKSPSEEEALEAVHSEEVQESVADWLVEKYPAPLNSHQGDWNMELRQVTTEEVINEATSRPWTSDDIPPLAEWVEANRPALDLLVEAGKRPKYYSPPPNYLDGSREGIIATLLPMAQNMREATKSLIVRAMWLMGEGRPEEAWDSLGTILQYARFNAQGNNLVEHIVAIAIEEIALQRVVQVISNQSTSLELARTILIQLRELPRFPNLSRKVDHGERIVIVEGILGFATGRSNGMNTQGESLMKYSADFNLILKQINQHYDRLTELSGIASRSDRIAGIEQFEKELEIRGNKASNVKGRGTELLVSRERRSEAIAEVFISLTTPAMKSICESQDSADTRRDLAIVAAALAVYRLKHGEHPEELEQLAPGILEEVPIDLYSEQPFIYRRMPEGGYLLYSVYLNGIDDGGTDLDGEIIGGEWADDPQEFEQDDCDLVIRVPFPAFQLPEPASD